MNLKKSIKSNKKSGFTLIELIAVMAIISILATVLLPQATGYIKEAKKTKIVDQCRKVVMAAESYAFKYAPLADTTTVSEIKDKAGVGKYLDGVTLDNLPDATTLKKCKSILDGDEFIIDDNDILDISKSTPVTSTPSTDKPEN